MSLLQKIGISETLYYTLWAIKKNIIIFFRSYASLILAGVLVIFSIIREGIDYFYKGIIENNPWLHQSWIAFLFVLLGLTILELIWEWRGEKLDVSDQEKRFAIGMRELLSEIDKQKRKIASAETITEVDELLKEFMVRFLRTSSKVLCGNNEVHAGIMLHNPQKESLELLEWTDKSGYVPFTIDLKKTKAGEIGPAQMSFVKNMLAHMPKKSRKLGWLYREIDEEQYVLDEFIRGWFEVPEADLLFDSVLSVPITSYAKPGKQAVHGVLNFTTATKDHFIPRDYMMAHCFASIIAQAKDAARDKIEELLFLNENDDAPIA